MLARAIALIALIAVVDWRVETNVSLGFLYLFPMLMVGVSLNRWQIGIAAAVDHAAGQYVCGSIHTQTIEGFWSLVKRGMVGTFHKVSKKYLPLYIAEFQFRYNNRSNPDIFGEAIKGC